MRTKDMYLPMWVCIMGVVFLAAGIACVVISFTGLQNNVIACWIIAVFCLVLGSFAILCWKNQWAEMLNDNEFAYSTMFGRQIRYHFSEIQDLKLNDDSMTLLLESGKVHIESCAVISERFGNRIDDVLGLK